MVEGVIGQRAKTPQSFGWIDVEKAGDQSTGRRAVRPIDFFELDDTVFAIVLVAKWQLETKKDGEKWKWILQRWIIEFIATGDSS